MVSRGIEVPVDNYDDVDDVSLSCKCTKLLDGYHILDLVFSYFISSPCSPILSCVCQ